MTKEQKVLPLAPCRTHGSKDGRAVNCVLDAGHACQHYDNIWGWWECTSTDSSS